MKIKAAIHYAIAAVYSTILEILEYASSFLYDAVISNQMTNFTYEKLALRFHLQSPSPRRILDVGVGTGVPLSQILTQLPPESTVLGIDIDHSYLSKANKIFRNSQKVLLREVNFYSMKSEEGKFDAIVFSSSFILMQQQDQALELAKKLLNEGGSIYFIVTLNDKPYVERITSSIKYFTAIDLQISHDSEFEKHLLDAGLVTVHKERLKKIANIPTNVLRVFMYETKLK